MIKFAVTLTLIALISSLTIHLHQDGGDTIVGGYQSLNVQKLPEDAKEVDAYVRNLHHFNDVTLLSASRQVVAGFNYHLIYQSKDKTQQWDIIVYKTLNGKLYENGYTYTVVLPNGQKVKAMADPASAFTGLFEQPKAVLQPISSQPKLIANVNSFPNWVEPIKA